MPACPSCQKPLTWDDWYVRPRYAGALALAPRHTKSGDIYRCFNEDCLANLQYFYTDLAGHVYEGYPAT